MKLSRMTVQTLKRAMDERLRKGDTTAPPLTDKQVRRDAIEAWLLDGRDIMVLLAFSQGDIASTIAKYRNELRQLGGAN